MLGLIFLLIIAPALLGRLIKDILEPETDLAPCLYYVLGFVAMVAQFSLLCYPSTVLDMPFHLLCLISCLLFAAECVTAAVVMCRKRLKRGPQQKQTINETVPVHHGSDTDRPAAPAKIRTGSQFESRIRIWLRSPLFWLMIAFCAFQIVRLILQQPFEPRDSKTYNVLINDIVQTDHLFRRQPLTGAAVTALSEIKLKYLMAPWYPFMAMVSVVSGLHPLIAVQTVMPAYVLLLHYLVIFSLGCFLFGGSALNASVLQRSDSSAAALQASSALLRQVSYTKSSISNICLFVFICAFLREITVTTSTPSIIELVWPAWGKGSLAAIIVPAVLLIFTWFYMSGDHVGRTNSASLLAGDRTDSLSLLTEKKTVLSGKGESSPDAADNRTGRCLLIMMICSIAGCSMSTMAVLILPIELGLLGLSWAWRQRSVKPVIFAILSALPVVIYTGVYLVLTLLR